MTYSKNFNDLDYKRIEFDKTKKDIDELINELKEASSFTSFLTVFKKIIDIQNEIEEMYDYADIRNMRDSSDKFYDAEINYWNEFKPKFDSLFLPFYDVILNSGYIEELKKFVPTNFFLTIEYQKKVTSTNIAELTSKEQKLKQDYKKLMNGKVIYNGEEMNISKLAGLLKSNDRNVRKEASDIYNNYFYERKSQFCDIFLKLVEVRKRISASLGFDSYIDYSLYKLRRFDYDYKDIREFRDNIRKYISPIINHLRELQKENLGLDEITYYDNIFFKRVPNPIYEGEKLLEEFGRIFKSLDNELYEMFTQLVENNYIDFIARDNKVGFSITNYLCKSCIPVITASYKNTYYDVTSTSHELGHAFQKYNASIMDKNYIVPSLLKYPTMEIAEMFSYAFVIIMLSHVDKLFNEKDYNKYCFQAIYDLVNILSYICLVDEFQESIYGIKKLTESLVHDTWLKLSKKYDLEYQNKGNENLESGCYFFRQNHIFLDPFYYIDYAISTIGAFSIASSCENDLDVFKRAAEVASYYPIKELSKNFNFPEPFKEESIKSLAKKLETKLEEYYKGVEK